MGTELANLTEDTTPDFTDWLYLVDSTGAVDKKVSARNLSRLSIGVGTPNVGTGFNISTPFLEGWEGNCSPSSSTQNSRGTLRVSPIWLSEQLTFDRIGVNVNLAATDAGSQVRLGIWEMNSTGMPGTLILDAGVIAILSTGSKEITINQTLPPGAYYAGMVFQTSGTFAGPNPQFYGHVIQFSWVINPGSNNHALGLSGNGGLNGALASSPSCGWNIQGTNGYQNPRVHLRVA